MLELLGADAVVADFVVAAIRAGGRHALAITAMVAKQRLQRLVQGQARVAVAAQGLPAAVVAHHDGRETAPVEIYQHLAGTLQVTFHERQGFRAATEIQAPVADVDQ